VFFHQAGQLPDEPRRLSLILAGARTEASWDVPPNTATPRYDFFDLKGVVEGLLGELHLSGVTFTPAKEIPHLHPGRAANVLVNGATVGAIGELHPKAATSFELTDFSILVAELDLDAVLAAVPDRYPYRPVSTFPPVLRDVAVVLAADVPAERVLQEIKTTGGDLLEAARLFDVYRGDSIPPGTKSLAFALTYRLPDRQLNDKEVDKTHQKIEGRLKSAFQGQIRGKEGT